MTEFHLRRTRTSREGDTVTCYLNFDGRIPLGEVTDFIRETDIAIDKNVTVGGGMFMWVAPATEEEMEGWREYDKNLAERARENRRAHYERLRAEFEEES